MDKRQNINEEVQKTLESLDNVQRAQANPYLFTRIRGRLTGEERSFWNLAFRFVSRPVVAVAAILLVILMNVAIILNQPSSTPTPTQEEEQYFASEYNLSGNTIYDATVDQQ